MQSREFTLGGSSGMVRFTVAGFACKQSLCEANIDTSAKAAYKGQAIPCRKTSE